MVLATSYNLGVIMASSNNLLPTLQTVNNMTAGNDEPACKLIDVGYGSGVLARQQSNSWCDINLYGNSSCFADGVSLLPIKAHKNILASASPHFNAAFTFDGLLESGAKKYTIDQIDHATLQSIVDFIYQSKLCVSGENVFGRLENIIMGADYLLMPQLVHLCGQALDKPAYLSATSCVSKWLSARKYHCEVLAVAAARTAATVLPVVAEQETFLNLSKDNVVDLVEYLAATSVDADTLCDAAAAWMVFDENVRKAWCDIVMRHVPFQKMTIIGLLRISKKTFVSADVLLKVQQMHEIRDELEKVKTIARTILTEYERLDEGNSDPSYVNTVGSGFRFCFGLSLVSPAERAANRKLAHDLLDE